MSLAMYAAPFNDNNNNIKNNDEDTLARKRTTHNRTQKRHPKEMYTTKVENIMNTLQNLPDEPEDSGLADFKPLPPPTSAGVEQTILRDNMKKPANEETTEKYTNYGTVGPVSNAANSDAKYDRFMPDYTNFTKNIPPQDKGQQMPYNHNSYHPSSENDALVEKLNYMISLLEQQQDEKTNNVTEELILYSFLGIFVIFLVDSFVRVGKYVR